jgi:hypothetical protein
MKDILDGAFCFSARKSYGGKEPRAKCDTRSTASISSRLARQVAAKRRLCGAAKTVIAQATNDDDGIEGRAV